MNFTTCPVLLKANSAQLGVTCMILIDSPTNKTPFMRLPSLLTFKNKYTFPQCENKLLNSLACQFLYVFD